MSEQARFYAESFAPFCERARWALDHHAIGYREIEQVPLVAELTLRLASRRLRGPVTVPLLVVGPRRIMGSHDIARWADEHGGGAPLFSDAFETEKWARVSDAIMESGRALLLERLLAREDALAEQLPLIPHWLRPSLRGVARLGVRHLRRKYATQGRSAAEHEGALHALIGEVRQRGGRVHAATFSYADITLASSLQFVRPVADEYIHLGPATHLAWTHERLAQEFTDVLAWRDELYAAFRRTRSARA